MKNFLFLRLGDNDYGPYLGYALEWLQANWAATLGEGAVEPEDIRQAVIALMLGYMAASDRMLGREPTTARSAAYLQSQLRVTYEEHAPAVDHDGSSAAVDLHTGYTWRM